MRTFIPSIPQSDFLPRITGPAFMEWLPFAIGALIVLIIILRVPFLRAAVRLFFTLALLAGVAWIVLERAPYDPTLAQVSSRLGLDRQEVAGNTVRIRMSADGHFWANVQINGVRRRMMIDSGATVTALSERTAQAAGLTIEAQIIPVVLQTANGTTEARTSTIGEMRLGTIVARDLKVVVSPALGNIDLLGMNFLSKLRSWSVEDGTLILVPHHPQSPSRE